MFSKKEKMRILSMLVALCVVIFLMFTWMPKKDDDMSNQVDLYKPAAQGSNRISDGVKPPPKNDMQPIDQGDNDILPPTTPPIDPAVGLLDPDPPQPHAPADYEAVVAAVKDSVEQEEKPFEPKALAYMLHKARVTPPDDPARLNAPVVTQKALNDDPEKWRGKWVKLVGTVYGDFYRPRRLQESGPSGLYIIFGNFLLNNDYRLFEVYTMDDKLLLKKGDILTVTGLFFKLDAYKAKKGWAVVPVILTDRMDRYDAPPKTTSPIYYVVVAAAAVIGLVLVVVLVVGGTRGIGYKKKRRLIKKDDRPSSPAPASEKEEKDSGDDLHYDKP